jgi:hypothetical protein
VIRRGGGGGGGKEEESGKVCGAPVGTKRDCQLFNTPAVLYDLS